MAMTRGGRRNWRRVYPTSLRHAIELCKEFALERRHLSVERIAERMALESHWVIYKWIESGRIPAVSIPAYEHVCGADFITRWLASTSGKLLVEIPTGRAASAQEMHQLQEVTNSAVGKLLNFYAGNASAEETLAAVAQALEGLAWHKANVEKSHQPELTLEAD